MHLHNGNNCHVVYHIKADVAIQLAVTGVKIVFAGCLPNHTFERLQVQSLSLRNAKEV